MGKVLLVMMALGIVLCAAPVPVLAASASASFFVPATAGGGTDELGGLPWFETGLIFRRGTTVTIAAKGFWQTCKERTCTASADGIGVRHVNDCTFIAPGLSAFGLLAQTGTNAPVLAGIGPTTIQGGGMLKFAINDCYFGDNVGGFDVTVTYPTDALLAAPEDDAAGG